MTLTKANAEACPACGAAPDTMCDSLHMERVRLAGERHGWPVFVSSPHPNMPKHTSVVVVAYFCGTRRINPLFQTE